MLVLGEVAGTLRGLDEKVPRVFIGFGHHQNPQVISGKSIAHLKGVGKVRAPQALVVPTFGMIWHDRCEETVKKIDQYIETGTSVAKDPPRACDVICYFGGDFSVQVCRWCFISRRMLRGSIERLEKYRNGED